MTLLMTSAVQACGSLHSGYDPSHDICSSSLRLPTFGLSEHTIVQQITLDFMPFRDLFADFRKHAIFVTLRVIMASTSTILLLLQQLLQTKSVSPTAPTM